MFTAWMWCAPGPINQEGMSSKLLNIRRLTNRRTATSEADYKTGLYPCQLAETPRSTGRQRHWFSNRRVMMNRGPHSRFRRRRMKRSQTNHVGGIIADLKHPRFNHTRRCGSMDSFARSVAHTGRNLFDKIELTSFTQRLEPSHETSEGNHDFVGCDETAR